LFFLLVAVLVFRFVGLMEEGKEIVEDGDGQKDNVDVVVQRDMGLKLLEHRGQHRTLETRCVFGKIRSAKWTESTEKRKERKEKREKKERKRERNLSSCIKEGPKGGEAVACGKRGGR
jgi:hypothetical protein